MSWPHRAHFTLVENAAMVNASDVGQVRRVVEVGAGQGGVCAEGLKAFPNVSGHGQGRLQS